MIGELWLLAVALGLLVSATLHFVFIWPAQEPSEPEDGPDGTSSSDRASDSRAASDPFSS